ncbi:hypothetical protein TNCV_2009841 [Trichonephila clavipes]|nr:hypothetical protein TNCV_2009841 [Trichonephila clavipes]
MNCVRRLCIRHSRKMAESDSSGSTDNVTIFLLCSICKTILVTNSIIENTENDYLVDKVENVEFDHMINGKGNVEIVCETCWIIIGYCDRNHENKLLFKKLMIKAIINGIQDHKPTHSSTS